MQNKRLLYSANQAGEGDKIQNFQMFVKICLFCGACLFALLPVKANDRTAALQIGTRRYSKAELAYAYKNYVADDKGRSKTVDAFVQQFISLQRKVLAARKKNLDTIPYIREAVGVQRARLLRPLLLSEAEKNAAALKVYTATKDEFKGRDLLKVATIFRYLPQNATAAQQQRERLLTDSLYNVLLKGGDFISLAHKYSSPEIKKENVVEWLSTGRTWSEYETQAYTLTPGQYSKPFLGVRGFYIVKLLERKPFPAFESVKLSLLKYMETNGLLLQLVQKKSDMVSDVLLKHPEVNWQIAFYKNAMLASEWDKLPENMRFNLVETYPVVLNEKVLHTLVEDYGK